MGHPHCVMWRAVPRCPSKSLPLLQQTAQGVRRMAAKANHGAGWGQEGHMSWLPEWMDNIPQTTSLGFTDSHPPHPSWAKSPYAQVDSWENVSLFQINSTNMIWAPTMWTMYKFLYKVPEELSIILHVFISLFCVFVVQLGPTLCNPMYCSLPGSPVHGISQARILEWVAISFSRGFSQSRDQNPDSYIDWQILYLWATGSAQWSLAGYSSQYDGPFQTEGSVHEQMT